MPTLLYILSSRRSGSTAVEYCLATHPDCVALGEVQLLEHYARQDLDRLQNSGGLCTCGVALPACPFWNPLLTAFSQETGTAITSLSTDARRIKTDSTTSQLDGTLNWLYTRIATQTGRMLLDSSKDLGYLATLRRALPGWDIRVLYVYRNPLTVVRSVSKWRRQHPTKRPLSLPSLLALWCSANLRMWLAVRRAPSGTARVMNFDRFRADPERSLADLAAWLELPPNFRTRLKRQSVHTVAGTPSRFASDEFVLERPGRSQPVAF